MVSTRLTAWSQQAICQMPSSQRTRECMDLAFMATFGGQNKSCDLTPEDRELLANLFVDCSQNPTRRAWSRAGVSRCLTTSTSLYSFERDLLVLALESCGSRGTGGT